MVSTTKSAILIAAVAMTTTLLNAQSNGFHLFSVHSVAELRKAIQSANELGGVNYVDVAPGVYYLAENALSRTELVIERGSLTIGGHRFHATRISGNYTGDRIFEVKKNAKLTLSDLILQGGTSPNVPLNSRMIPGDGGGIYNEGTLAALRCVLSGNWMGVSKIGGIPDMRSADGGAIYNAGNLSAIDCTFAGNGGGNLSFPATGGHGGAIYNSGLAILRRCTIDRNEASDGGFGTTAAGNGGGIYNSGRMLVDHCLVSDNICGSGVVNFLNDPLGGGPGGSGGGIFNAGRMVIDSTMLAGNSSGTGGNEFRYNGGNGGAGGGVANTGMLTITRTCVYENKTGAGASTIYNGTHCGNGGDGAGIFNEGELKASLSTIAYNFCGNGGSPTFLSVYPIEPVIPGTFVYGAVYYPLPPGPIPYPIPLPVPGPFTNLPPGYQPPTPATGGAGGNGGGIYNVGTFTAVSCTICSNVTGCGGPGVAEIGLAGSVVPVRGGSGGNGGDGGGVLNADNASITFTNTIIALNLALPGGAGGGATLGGGTIGSAGNAGVGADFRGTIVSGGFNLIGNADGGSVMAQSSDIIGNSASPTDPLFSPLTVFFNSVYGYSLETGSPAIDQGNSCGLKTDATGNKRVKDDPNVPNAPGGDGADIGAVEGKWL